MATTHPTLRGNDAHDDGGGPDAGRDARRGHRLRPGQPEPGRHLQRWCPHRLGNDVQRPGRLGRRRQAGPRAGRELDDRGRRHVVQVQPPPERQVARRPAVHRRRREVHLRAGAAEAARPDPGVGRHGQADASRRPTSHGDLPLREPLRPAPAAAERHRGADHPQARLRGLHRPGDGRRLPGQQDPGRHRAVQAGELHHPGDQDGPEPRLLPARPALPRRHDQRVIPDAGTQLLALENGEIDWVGSVPGPDIERTKANRALGTATAPRGSGGGNCTTDR